MEENFLELYQEFIQLVEEKVESAEAAMDILREARGILRGCFVPEHAGHVLQHTILVGRVQIGKTLLLHALMLVAAVEHRCGAVIVLTTNNSALREQTQRRVELRHDLHPDLPVLHLLTSAEEDLPAHQRQQDMRERPAAAEVLVCTTKKNVACLDRLLDPDGLLVGHEHPGPWLILNDEGDVATLDNGGRGGQLHSAMHQRLVQLANLRPAGRTQLISVTATPQALLLQPQGSALSFQRVHLMGNSRPGNTPPSYVPVDQMRVVPVPASEFAPAPLGATKKGREEFRLRYFAHQNRHEVFLCKFVETFVLSAGLHNVIIDQREPVALGQADRYVHPPGGTHPSTELLRLMAQRAGMPYELLAARLLDRMRATAAESEANPLLSIGIALADLNEDERMAAKLPQLAHATAHPRLRDAWIGSACQEAGVRVRLWCQPTSLGVLREWGRRDAPAIDIAVDQAAPYRCRPLGASQLPPEEPEPGEHRRARPHSRFHRALLHASSINEIHQAATAATERALQTVREAIRRWVMIGECRGAAPLRGSVSAHWLKMLRLSVSARLHLLDVLDSCQVVLWTGKERIGDELSAGRNVIFVGGDVFSRGLTLHQLTTMAFLRETKKPCLDTWMQQMRIQGHHPGYAGLLTLMVPASAHQKLLHMQRADELLRTLLAEYSEGDQDELLGPRVLVPAVRGLQPTNPRKRRRAQFSRFRVIAPATNLEPDPRRALDVIARLYHNLVEQLQPDAGDTTNTLVAFGVDLKPFFREFHQAHPWALATLDAWWTAFVSESPLPGNAPDNVQPRTGTVVFKKGRNQLPDGDPAWPGNFDAADLVRSLGLCKRALKQEDSPEHRQFLTTDNVKGAVGNYRQRGPVLVIGLLHPHYTHQGMEDEHGICVPNELSSTVPIPALSVIGPEELSPFLQSLMFYYQK